MPFDCAACRSCAGAVRHILDLGTSPVANRLLNTPHDPVALFPLGLVQCVDCGLVQNATILPSDVLFDEGYPYFASVSAAVRAHAENLADALARRLPSNARTLEIGSNDGAVQLALHHRGIFCLGVDPASGPAQAARDAGMETITGAFDSHLAARMAANYPPFDAVHMSNVLAHIGAPGALLRAAALCLAEQGVLVIEVQSWLALVQNGGFDMVYHEHHSHFSLGTIAPLLADCGLSITGFESINMQGGSLRIWARKGGRHAAVVSDAIHAEAVFLAHAPDQLSAAVARFRRDTARFLNDLGGAPLYGYGAAAKTVTLLAASGQDWPLIAIADAAPSKSGRYLPLGAIPIISPADLPQKPAHLFLFAWNLADEITPRFANWPIYVPVPHLRRLQ